MSAVPPGSGDQHQFLSNRIGLQGLDNDPLDAEQPSNYFPDSHTVLAPQQDFAILRVTRRCALAQPPRRWRRYAPCADPLSCHKSPFFFSVQTMGTIGYGAIYPESFAANCVVVAESIVGLIVTALSTGLVFAKFSRPTARVVFMR